uniref:Uncharacterized protein n=1 Tax=Micrurus surinamensis TaxID=129470 RepID=A0A2D4PIR0_MICSU
MLGYLLSRSYLFSEDGVTEVLAHHGESIPNKFIEVPCSEDYDSHKRFEGCTPRKCGRGITDAIINREEAEQIRRLQFWICTLGLFLWGSILLICTDTLMIKSMTSSQKRIFNYIVM